MNIVHLDGHLVPLQREKITWSGARISKAKEGMPNYENNNVRGTLYITFDVEFPKGELSEEEREGNWEMSCRCLFALLLLFYY